MTAASARPADAGDVEDICALIVMGIDELRPLRGGEMLLATAGRAHPLEPTLLEQLADADTLVVCGEYEGVPVGYAVVRLEPTDDGRRYASITDLYTRPAARHVGVGEAMLEQVIDWSRQRGAFSLDALALPGARDTKNFFESFGLTARALTVNRSL